MPWQPHNSMYGPLHDWDSEPQLVGSGTDWGDEDPTAPWATGLNTGLEMDLAGPPEYDTAVARRELAGHQNFQHFQQGLGMNGGGAAPERMQQASVEHTIGGPDDGPSG
eukprot:COSAG06_NODE_46892_length_343_cov_1.057377_1_plen_108_part_10